MQLISLKVTIMKFLSASAFFKQTHFRVLNGLSPVILLLASFTIAFLWLAGFQTEAATIIWTNTLSGSWNTAANWNPNSVPGLNDNAIITNAGVTVSLNGSTTVGAIILGTNGAGTVTLALAGQTLGLNGPLTVNPNGSFTVDSGILDGNTNAVLSGTIGWTAGDLTGILTISSGSILNITTANVHDIPNCTLTNNGVVVWASGQIRGGNTTIYNDGLWDAQNDQVFNNSLGGSNPVFNNLGTFRKSGGAGEFANATFFQNVIFNQLAGEIDVQNGTNGLELALQGGGNLTGGFISTNAQGLTVLSIGNFTVNGTVTGTNTWEDAGSLVGTNVINGALNWVSGNWDAAPSVTIASNSKLIVAGGNGVNDLDYCILTNNGTVVWASGQIRGGQVTVYNNGLWDAQSDQVVNDTLSGSPFIFNNLGTFRKSGGVYGSSSQLQNGVFFNNVGTLDVQTGIVSLLGTYNLTNGTLDFTLHSLTNFGQLNLVSSVALGGSMNVSLFGGFTPTIGDQFHVILSSGLSGNFNSVSVPAGISVAYSNSGVFLDAIGLIPVQIINTKLLGTNLLFQFSTISGQSYTIQSNDDLATNNWAFYTNFIGDGSMLQFQTPVLATPALNFFRVREP
jgi:hypothetical protein